MTPGLFELADNEVPSHRDAPEMHAAARAVLVDGTRAVDAAAKFGINPSHLSRLIAQIRVQLRIIADREGWVLRTQVLALRPRLVDAVQELEDVTIEPLRERQQYEKSKK